MVLGDDVLVIKDNEHSSLEIEDDSKVDGYNRNISISYSIRTLMEDI